MSNLFFFSFPGNFYQRNKYTDGTFVSPDADLFPPKNEDFFSPELALSSHLTGKEIQEEITEP